jgi:hypothetical protein
MPHIEFWITAFIMVVGGIVHIEVNLAILKNDIKWIKKELNTKGE